MSERLPAPQFDSQSYERPNQKWICGYAVQGTPCRVGPDNRGRCRATAECRPVLEKKPGEEKGRWRCMRAGGQCENGPLPNGSCSCPILKCAPLPTLRTRRAQVTQAVVVATIALLLILLGGSWRGNFINPEALSTPHSSDKFAKLHGANLPSCAACHKAGDAGPSGLIAGAWQAKPGPLAIVDLASARVGEMTAIDEACQKCHTSHALHGPNVARKVSCSYCHEEHRGAGAIAATTPAHCSICHGDAEALKASLKTEADTHDKIHLRGSSPQTLFQALRPRTESPKVIRRFSEDHPEFRLHADKKRDPDTLKFNHALHLTSGTIPPWPTGQQLNCASCHQPGLAGLSFQSISFEKHCRVCHSLQFDPDTPGLTLPHGDPAFVTAFLHSLPKQYADFGIRSGMSPGKELSDFARQKLHRLQARVGSGEDLEERVFFSTATTGPEVRVGSVSGPTPSLYPGCAYCHNVAADARGQANIEKPILVEHWLPRARFSHATHAAVSCSQCHPASSSKNTEDIILPRKSSCVACHSAKGGVSDSCVTCHSYHSPNSAISSKPQIDTKL